MTILSSFFDPSSNGMDVTDVGIIVAVITGIVGALYGFWRWSRSQVHALVNRWREYLQGEIRGIVSDEVKRATQPIQPGYRNGGESLADVSATLQALCKHVGMTPD
jgi:hypothetical protein